MTMIYAGIPVIVPFSRSAIEYETTFLNIDIAVIDGCTSLTQIMLKDTICLIV